MGYSNDNHEKMDGIFVFFGCILFIVSYPVTCYVGYTRWLKE